MGSYSASVDSLPRMHYAHSCSISSNSLKLSNTPPIIPPFVDSECHNNSAAASLDKGNGGEEDNKSDASFNPSLSAIDEKNVNNFLESFEQSLRSLDISNHSPA